ncbi:Phenol hydroxylase, C-terminal dimerization [Trichophyton interdigitale]|uniref:Phenol monooxygenase n=1 Tax=Trichophyton interdigitale TaxID=101480 RepID=A0A9P4YNK7_9EURO|nr:Phenol monooxygenase [Trichophyton interdigitale]KAF3901023.1 Phenol monooxygenase [Trichophyton interdigitale]KAG8208914.1 Phenol hydroxylase, C-terminal dimerization [Trichophyton interdigitale]
MVNGSLAVRGSRVALPYAAPLPRIGQQYGGSDGDEKYEVVIVGAGPAGYILNILLARHGLTDQSLLCIDLKPTRVMCGQADGLQPRTLEVLKTMGLADPLLQDGCYLWEMMIWKPSKDGTIERFSVIDNKIGPARYQRAITISQGIIEQVFDDDLAHQSQRGVQRNSKLVNVSLDEAGDPDFPVIAAVETDGVPRTVRAKFLVGTDGAHSTVRKCAGIQLNGESIDDFWGVIDFVADTDFPDIRRFGRVHSRKGTIMVIPREQTVDGDYLTRLYVQMPHQEEPEDGSPRTEGNGTEPRKSRKSQITLEKIFQQVSEIFEPYYIRPKAGVDINWWTVYQIGQRIAERFAIKDSKGLGRVILAGDSCHTHSPKAGQGMNISMMDAHNLSWKLAYTINGLHPDVDDPGALLKSYEVERYSVAQQLIDFDKKYSTGFSKRTTGEENEVQATLKQNLEVYEQSIAFASGCGIEYPETSLIDRTFPDGYQNPVRGTDYFHGILRPGRRLLNVTIRRFADGFHRDIHDDLVSNGRFRILCMTSTDLLDSDGTSARIILSISALLPLFPPSLIEAVVIYPRLPRELDWNCLPKELKQMAEMRFYSGYEVEDAYKVYGVDPDNGALAVIRPDGCVGVISRLDDIPRLETYLEKCMKKPGKTPTMPNLN